MNTIKSRLLFVAFLRSKNNRYGRKDDKMYAFYDMYGVAKGIPAQKSIEDAFLMANEYQCSFVDTLTNEYVYSAWDGWNEDYSLKENINRKSVVEYEKIHRPTTSSSEASFVVTISDEYVRDIQIFNPSDDTEDDMETQMENDNNWTDFKSGSILLGVYAWKDNDINGLKEYVAFKHCIPKEIIRIIAI